MPKDSLKLFFSHYSPPSRAVCLVSKALGLDLKLIEVDILSKKYLAHELILINPQHTVPTLQDGNFVVWDSHAISGYLVGMYGTNNEALYPKEPSTRAIVDQRLHFDTENLFPRIVEAAYPLLFKSKTTISNNVRENVKRSYGFLEKFLKRNKWLAGSDMTIADLCCISSISTLDYLVPISNEYKQLSRYLERCKQLPYYQEANQISLDMLGTKIQERLIETYIRNHSIKM